MGEGREGDREEESAARERRTGWRSSTTSECSGWATSDSRSTDGDAADYGAQLSCSGCFDALHSPCIWSLQVLAPSSMLLVVIRWPLSRCITRSNNSDHYTHNLKRNDAQTRLLELPLLRNDENTNKTNNTATVKALIVFGGMGRQFHQLGSSCHCQPTT